MRINAELIATAATESERILLTIHHAVLACRVWETETAADLLDRVRPAVAAHGLHRPYACVTAMLAAMCLDSQIAVDAATDGLCGSGWLDDTFELHGVIGLVDGLLSVGRVDTLPTWAERGYELARTSVVFPVGRFFLAMLHTEAFRLCGCLDEADQVADRLAHEPMDLSLALTHRGLANGVTAAVPGLGTRGDRGCLRRDRHDARCRRPGERARPRGLRGDVPADRDPVRRPDRGRSSH